MPNQPLVSVAMITYNHRPFIAQALDSVLSQRRDFPIEIVISDDCSPDGAATIIDEYQARHPGIIRRLDPPQNVGMNRNFQRVWKACTGKYVAMLEGDDWWKEDKLAIQVAFMEGHPECTISGNMVNNVDAQGTAVEDRPVGWPELSDIRLLINGSCLPTPSVMCRRGVVPEIPEWVIELGMGDWPICLLHATKGRIGFIDRPLSCYRMHAGGIWSPLGQHRQLERMLHAAKVMRAHFPKEYFNLFEGAIGYIHFQLFRAQRDLGNFWTARKHLWQSCIHRLRAREFTLDMIYKVPVRMMFPSKW